MTVTLICRAAALALMLAALLAGSPDAGAAEGIPLNRLVERAAELDGQSVTVEGEVIGDILLRGPEGWVNLYDGTGNIGARAPVELLNRIGVTGNYGVQGDRIRVTGIFYRADPAAGGEPDVVARALVVVQPGHPVARPVRRERLAMAVAALGLGGALAALWLRRHRGAGAVPGSR